MNPTRTIPMGMAVVAVLLAGCDAGTRELDVRTFSLEYIDAGDATEIIAPYVFTDREDAPGTMSAGRAGTITVRETPDMLDRIEQVLERYDRPQPTVKLRFQLIEADGATEADPAIADVEKVLRELFRFDGYTLEADALVRGLAGSGFAQQITTPRQVYELSGDIGEVRAGDGSGTVELEVQLVMEGVGFAFGSTVNARAGQTMVLGTAKPDPERGALILTVRPEIERP